MRYVMYNGALCVEGLLEAAGAGEYANLYRSGLRIARMGGRGRTSLAAYDSIRADWRERIADELGDPREQSGDGGFVSMVQPDREAMSYYESILLADGRYLPADTQIRYANSAAILNALRTLELQYIQSGRGGVGYLSIAVASMPILSEMYPNVLPESARRLKPRYEEYKAGGYETIMHGGYGNANARVVNDNVKRLILSISAMPQKPYDGTVLEIYREWMGGAYDLYDEKSGEIFDRADFTRNGKMIDISLSTVRRITGHRLDKAAVDSKLMTFHDFNSNHRPHRHRNNKLMSGSMITMDDRDLPRMDKAGRRPKAYYAFDVGSEALIGWAYSRDKDAALYESCMRHMFQSLQSHNLAMPAEVQVENHLVKEYFPHLRAMFTFVRVCAPTNSQEKRAEQLIKLKKYGYEKKIHANVGRHYLRNSKNVLNTERLNDEDVERKWDYDELIADDIASIEAYNHDKLAKFGGRSRWEMFLENQNPQLKPFEPHTAAYWFGMSSKEALQIYRNQYVTVVRGKYAIPSPAIMEQLPQGKATAHWMPSGDGAVPSVYLYHDGRYVCECKRIEGYRTAQAERTDADADLKLEQDKYVAQFDREVKTRSADLAKIKKLPITQHKPAERVPIPLAVYADPEPQESWQDVLDDYSPEAMARRAMMDL